LKFGSGRVAAAPADRLRPDPAPRARAALRGPLIEQPIFYFHYAILDLAKLREAAVVKCPCCSANVVDDSSFCGKCGASVRPAGGKSVSDTQTQVGAADEIATETLLAGKFRILETLGRGGMGIVYKAEDTKLKRPVALKFLPPEFAADPQARGRFVLEARAAAALSHPNICTIHEIHDAGEKSFLEMEFVEGQSLRARLRQGPLGIREAVDIAIQVAEGLEEAHAKGVIHRDIKSANIMVTGKGQAKIMDFGLAKVRGETMHTREGTTLGTAAYMSPEQARGKEVDHRTDLWSLGVVLYEMLSGRLPFRGEQDSPVLYAVTHEEPRALKTEAPGIPSELEHVVGRALRKDPNARYSSATEILDDLRKYRDAQRAEEFAGLSLATIWRAVRKPKLAIPAAVCLVVLSAAAAWFIHRQSRIRWAREIALPEIERTMVDPKPGFSNVYDAYRMAETAERYIVGDPTLARLLERCSVTISVKTDPPGAAVYIRKLASTSDQDWLPLGITPIEKIRLPAGYLRWRIEKEGYETVWAAATTFQRDVRRPTGRAPNDLFRVLDRTGKIPPGMVRVQGQETPAGKLGDFFLDKYEVTNKQFKEFVARGGYRERKYWQHQFVKTGKTLTWEQAMSEFVDQTGRPGPSTWDAGDYPKGQDEYPVSGVSWFEAAAYCAGAGKTLPTATHWGVAAGMDTPALRQAGLSSWLALASNFKGQAPAAVGSHQGLSLYGALDMAGNVREWCWNETREGRVIRGGAWNDASYMSGNRSQALAFDRSPKNGFRCATYIDANQIPQQAFAPVVPPEAPDFYREKPVPDSTFQVYREQFAYDPAPLNARIEWRNENSSDWVQEKVVFDAVYGGEKVPAYLFLPRNSKAPYQVVIYFPGSGSTAQASSKNLDQYGEFSTHLSFIVKNGRAVLYPVYKGTFERSDPAITPIHTGAPTRQYSEYLAQTVRDFRRSLDYLETRSDIDSKRLAYLGMSWGGLLGCVIPAVEERLKASVLIVGGMWASPRPEARAPSYVSRVRTPTLMLNGRYDMTFPFETAVKPMFDLLGTPAADKRLRLYDTDHFVPRDERVKETLAWLDRYLGPVK
jgi:formylglycine-generating enzyme required for sulfatase activity/dienelactone hydrolase/predicted Ser/Thr protein kinase